MILLFLYLFFSILLSLPHGGSEQFGINYLEECLDLEVLLGITAY